MAAYRVLLLSRTSKCMREHLQVLNYSIERCTDKLMHGNPQMLSVTGGRQFLTTAVAPEGNLQKEGATSEEVSDSVKPLKEEIDKLNKEIGVLTQKTKDIDDKYKRSLAESENMRKRLQKQIEDAKLFGIQGFCKDLLEVSDILSKATETVPSEALAKDQHLKNLFEGVKMTEAQLQAVFKRHGLAQINPLGEKFDPNFHEALFEQVVEGKEAGSVVTVTKVGYKLHERVIRPALVGVSKAS